MALVKISQTQLCALGRIRASETEQILTSLGIPLEAKEGDELSLEITPNRPDWLSVEGIARSAYSYKTGKPKSYHAIKSDVQWNIDSSVNDVRPCLGSAYVLGVDMTNELFDSLIQLQEKLHDTMGRNRRKMAIGIHDMSSISPPYTYKAVGREEVRFVPLGHSSPSSCGQILLEHEKGIAYAHLVGEKCPIIVDSNQEVLSFPPIINGERTRVGQNSKNLLIDCTGTNPHTILATVNIIAAALADHNGKVYSVKINSKTYPVFESRPMPLPLKEARALLDQNLDAQKISAHLRRMGHETSGRLVLPAPFRSDILHAVDLIEDIAISIGYNNFNPVLPNFPSISSFKDDSALHETMLGLGYFEVSSWILTNRKVLKNCGIDTSLALSVSNPLTEEFSTLRPHIYPNLLDIFSRSKSEPFPQYIYEIGPVQRLSRKIKESLDTPDAGSESPAQSSNPALMRFEEARYISAAATHPKACLSETLSHLGGFLSAFNMHYSLLERDISGFIAGRCADIVVDGEKVGLVGEVHPQVLESFGLEQPVALFELDADLIFKK